MAQRIVLLLQQVSIQMRIRTRNRFDLQLHFIRLTFSFQSDVQKQDSSFLTIHQLFSAPPSDDQLDDSQNSQQKSNDLPTSKRNRSRKAPPARLQKPTMEKTNESSFDWLQDEDELFGKIIALRLRTLSVEKKRQMKILIEQLFERGDS